jgi:hypothetical protein
MEKMYLKWSYSRAECDQKLAILMKLHMTNGISFVASFVDDFRKESEFA